MDIKSLTQPVFSLKWWSSWFLILLGCTLLAAGYVFFISPYNIVPGGVYGASIVLHNIFPNIQVGTFGYMFDIPLLFNKGTTKDIYTKTLAMFIFERYSGQLKNYGISAAASIILFIVTAILGAFVFYMNRDKEEIAEKKRRRREAKRLKGGGF